jgi:transcription elongation factor Elf1
MKTKRRKSKFGCPLCGKLLDDGGGFRCVSGSRRVWTCLDCGGSFSERDGAVWRPIRQAVFNFERKE